MAEILRMPEIAANTAEAVLSAWAVPVGGEFAAGDTLVTVETDKAVVDVAAETAGVVLQHLVPEGTTVAVGAAIALFGAVGEVAGAGDATPPPAPAAPAPDRPSDADSSVPQRIFASPLARRMARDAGVPLAALTGSGPNGRIRRRDVEAYVSSTAIVAAAAPPPGSAPAAPYTDVPNSRMRSAIAARLVESKQTVPHFYLRGSARVDALLTMRDELNHDAAGRVSVTDLVVKAVGRTHLLVPALNVTWAGDAVRQFRTVDVGIAVATDGGLVTPVVRAVDGLTVTALAATTRDLSARAREKRLQQSELEGGTITVTNLGMYGTEEFAAIINPPQAAILAVGAAREEPVVVDGGLTVGTVLRVTLSVDHRAVDGATAAEWMRSFLDLLEHPVRILA